MARNKKKTSKKVASLAAGVLQAKDSSEIAKTLAASVLAQVDPAKQTGAELEDLASKALTSPKYSDTTKTLAASVLSQSNKER